MRGSIISYSNNRGLISGADNNRYQFTSTDWSGKGEPLDGVEVDFTAEGGLARDIFPLKSNSRYSKVLLAIICWFFGAFGAHRFMVGKIGTGLIMLLLTLTIYGIIITSIWTIVDFIMILMGKFKDKDGNPVTGE